MWDDSESTLVWADASAGGATTALDNLASVAINTSLISDADSTDDLGASDKYWANLYVDKIYLGVVSTIEAGDVDGWNACISEVVEDASPQLGADLDVNSHNIAMGGQRIFAYSTSDDAYLEFTNGGIKIVDEDGSEVLDTSDKDFYGLFGWGVGGTWSAKVDLDMASHDIDSINDIGSFTTIGGISPVADNTYSFDATSQTSLQITTKNGIITAISIS
jgi:hypothetical protein